MNQKQLKSCIHSKGGSAVRLHIAHEWQKPKIRNGCRRPLGISTAEAAATLHQRLTVPGRVPHLGPADGLVRRTITEAMVDGNERVPRVLEERDCIRQDLAGSCLDCPVVEDEVRGGVRAFDRIVDVLAESDGLATRVTDIVGPGDGPYVANR